MIQQRYLFIYKQGKFNMSVDLTAYRVLTGDVWESYIGLRTLLFLSEATAEIYRLIWRIDGNLGGANLYNREEVDGWQEELQEGDRLTFIIT